MALIIVKTTPEIKRNKLFDDNINHKDHHFDCEHKINCIKIMSNRNSSSSRPTSKCDKKNWFE